MSARERARAHTGVMKRALRAKRAARVDPPRSPDMSPTDHRARYRYVCVSAPHQCVRMRARRCNATRNRFRASVERRRWRRDVVGVVVANGHATAATASRV